MIQSEFCVERIELSLYMGIGHYEKVKKRLSAQEILYEKRYDILGTVSSIFYNQNKRNKFSIPAKISF